jgi:hypothetical protein
MNITYKSAAVIAVLFVLGSCFLYMCYRGITDFNTAEHVPSVPWLPAGATNVSYYCSYNFTAYEFDIEEEGFLNWASDWEVKPITKEFKIMRYTLRAKYPNFVPNPSKQALDDYENIKNAIIMDGYFYENRQKNGGGVCVAYDRKTKRAYFQSNPR